MVVRRKEVLEPLDFDAYYTIKIKKEPSDQEVKTKNLEKYILPSHYSISEVPTSDFFYKVELKIPEAVSKQYLSEASELQDLVGEIVVRDDFLYYSKESFGRDFMDDPIMVVSVDLEKKELTLKHLSGFFKGTLFTYNGERYFDKHWRKVSKDFDSSHIGLKEYKDYKGTKKTHGFIKDWKLSEINNDNPIESVLGEFLYDYS